MLPRAALLLVLVGAAGGGVWLWLARRDAAIIVEAEAASAAMDEELTFAIGLRDALADRIMAMDGAERAASEAAIQAALALADRRIMALDNAELARHEAALRAALARADAVLQGPHPHWPGGTTLHRPGNGRPTSPPGPGGGSGEELRWWGFERSALLSAAYLPLLALLQGEADRARAGSAELGAYAARALASPSFMSVDQGRNARTVDMCRGILDPVSHALSITNATGAPTDSTVSRCRVAWLRALGR